METKQIKQNVNYFMKNDRLKTFGMIMVIVCVALAVFGNYYLLVIGGTLLPVGIVLFYLGTSSKASDADLDAFLAQKREQWQVAPEEDRHYAKRIQNRFEPQTVQGHEYRQGLMLKKAKNGNLRSSEYTFTHVIFLTDALYCAVRTVTLTDENPQDRVREIPYDTIQSAELLHTQTTLTFGNQTFAAKVTELAIACEDTAFRCPVADDMNSEELIQKIQKAVREYRKEQDQK